MRASLLLLLLVFSLAACQETTTATAAPSISVEVIEGPDRTELVRGKMRGPLGVLDRNRVLALTRVYFPDAEVREDAARAVIILDEPETATACFQAAIWVDGVMLARAWREEEGLESDTPAAIVAESLRRYLHVDPPVEPPDWAALFAALDDDALWEVAPQSAGAGALLVAGVLISQPLTDPARERAVGALAKCVVATEMPNWLTWAAYRMWKDRDFLAREESP